MRPLSLQPRRWLWGQPLSTRLHAALLGWRASRRLTGSRWPAQGLAARSPRAQVEDEFTRLFFGFGAGGEITPTASFYRTGFINDKPLANLRQDLLELGITVSGLNKEPEDHIAFLCEVMHGLITGALGARDQEGVGLDMQKSFFQRHLAAWAARLFGDLEAADAAVLYMPVGTVGKLFMTVEAEAFEMAA